MNGNKDLFIAIRTMLILIVALSVLTSTSCKRKISCNPDIQDVCPSGTVCREVASGKGQCLEVCQPDDDRACTPDELCLHYADNTYACTPECTPGGLNNCPADWVCAPVMGDKHVCRPECDLNASLCRDNEVCRGGAIAVVLPPAGLPVHSLPDGYSREKAGGADVFRFGETLFKPVFVQGVLAYQVVGGP